jgi:hypothetical protein
MCVSSKMICIGSMGILLVVVIDYVIHLLCAQHRGDGLYRKLSKKLPAIGVSSNQG